jgi:hypothetical protein
MDGFLPVTQLEIRSENQLKISGKGETSGKHRTKNNGFSGISGFSAIISNWDIYSELSEL